MSQSRTTSRFQSFSYLTQHDDFSPEAIPTQQRENFFFAQHNINDYIIDDDEEVDFDNMKDDAMKEEKHAEKVSEPASPIENQNNTAEGNVQNGTITIMVPENDVQQHSQELFTESQEWNDDILKPNDTMNDKDIAIQDKEALLNELGEFSFDEDLEQRLQEQLQGKEKETINSQQDAQIEMNEQKGMAASVEGIIVDMKNEQRELDQKPSTEAIIPQVIEIVEKVPIDVELPKCTLAQRLRRKRTDDNAELERIASDTPLLNNDGQDLPSALEPNGGEIQAASESTMTSTAKISTVSRTTAPIASQSSPMKKPIITSSMLSNSKDDTIDLSNAQDTPHSKNNTSSTGTSRVVTLTELSQPLIQQQPKEITPEVEQICEYYGIVTFQRGLAYKEENRIFNMEEECVCELEGVEMMRITSKCWGTRLNAYEQEVLFQLSDGIKIARARCDCPVSVDCKHTCASLLIYLDCKREKKELPNGESLAARLQDITKDVYKVKALMESLLKSQEELKSQVARLTELLQTDQASSPSPSMLGKRSRENDAQLQSADGDKELCVSQDVEEPQQKIMKTVHFDEQPPQMIIYSQYEEGTQNSQLFDY